MEVSDCVGPEGTSTVLLFYLDADGMDFCFVKSIKIYTHSIYLNLNIFGMLQYADNKK